MRIVLADKARRDVLQVYSYLAERNPQAAINFIDTVDPKLKTIVHFPFIGRERSSLAVGLRSLVVGRHVIFYLVQSDQILVVRVIDGRRDIDHEFRR